MRAAKPRVDKTTPKPPAELTRIEEANVARLGLISIQERIPADFTGWTIDFHVDGRPARLSCVAPSEYGGVPHGLDGDIATAITDLYVEAGVPTDGVLHTTAHQILRRAGLDLSGRYHQALRQALMRLRTTTYMASEAWRDHGRGNWTTVTFNYLEGLEFTSDNDRTELTRNSTLKIRLAEPIVKSIRAKYTKPLDLDFLVSLDRPITRAIYRLLDARRYPVDDPREALTTYSVNLIEWAQACKIVDLRSNKIRATLQGAHDELTERGYLKSVEYDGRGQKQTVTYHFAHDSAEDAPSPLQRALAQYRVSAPVALKLIEEHGEEHVTQRLEKFERLLAGGYKVRNRSALLVDVIRDASDKYPEPEAPTRTTPKAPKTPPAGSYMPTLEESSSTDLTLEAQVDTAQKTLQFLLRERLSVSEYALLRMGLIVGQPDAQTATRAAATAKINGTLDEFAADLLLTLRHLKLPSD